MNKLNSSILLVFLSLHLPSASGAPVVTNNSLANLETSLPQTGNGAVTPQYGVTDVKPHVNGQCKYGSRIGPWVGSPCSKIYGTNSPSNGPSVSTNNPDVINNPVSVANDWPAVQTDYLRGNINEVTPPTKTVLGIETKVPISEGGANFKSNLKAQ